MVELQHDHQCGDEAERVAQQRDVEERLVEVAMRAMVCLQVNLVAHSIVPAQRNNSIRNRASMQSCRDVDPAMQVRTVTIVEWAKSQG